MPIEDGYSLIRKIRALRKEKGGQISAIAVTAYTTESDRLRAIEAGFQIHVAKPIEPNLLLNVVANLVGVGNKASSP
jgi:two-component system, chemotaxis family, CheB/CheR fusion protein